ncbi:MAG: T9SS type A sorting domain-containing protein [Bacteroidota bacterium]
MNKNLLLLQILILLPLSAMLAQERVVINIENVEADPFVESEVCVPVTVDSFPQVAALQFDIKWDSEVIQLTNVDLGDNPLNLLSNDYNQLTDSTWRVLWSIAGVTGITLDFQTELFRLCYGFPADQEGMTDVVFDPDGATIFALSNPDTFFTLPFTANDGSVSLLADVSSVDLPTWANDVTVFPNPTATDQIQLQGNYPNLDGIAIFDLQGQLIRAYVPSSTTIPLDGLPAGQYVLRLQSGVEQANYKLIKH